MHVPVAAAASTIAMSRRLCVLGAGNRIAGPDCCMTALYLNLMISIGAGLNNLSTPLTTS